jgi:hypothetical protein
VVGEAPQESKPVEVKKPRAFVGAENDLLDFSDVKIFTGDGGGKVPAAMEQKPKPIEIKKPDPIVETKKADVAIKNEEKDFNLGELFQGK